MTPKQEGISEAELAELEQWQHDCLDQCDQYDIEEEARRVLRLITAYRCLQAQIKRMELDNRHTL